jgi:hypothetical protein
MFTVRILRDPKTQNTAFLILKAVGTYTYHCALKVKLDFGEIMCGCMYWIHRAQDRNQYQVSSSVKCQECLVQRSG